MTDQKENGYTITYFGWDDGKPRVAGRFKTEKEKDEFMNKITQPDSGWMNKKLSTITCHNDYNYALPF